ncbi:MAG: hypothetical protein U0793_12625 [Gemmataceae bacterium]
MLAAVLVVCGYQGVAGAGEDARNKVAKHWAELSAAEESRAVRAALALAAQPDETLAFLKDELRPVKDDPVRVAALLADLASPKFVMRERAGAELEYYGKYIKSHVEKALAEKPALEAAKRLQGLLDRMPQPPRKAAAPLPPIVAPGMGVSVSIMGGTILINGKRLEEYVVVPPPPPGPPPTPSSWVRATRAVGVLEHIGTPAARALIERLASGEADALPTIEAKAALGRMAK